MELSTRIRDVSFFMLRQREPLRIAGSTRENRRASATKVDRHKVRSSVAVKISRGQVHGRGVQPREVRGKGLISVAR